MRSIGKLYSYANYLSLDVSVGSMVCAAFFSRILVAQIGPYCIISLGLTVWVIYTSDHLLDARKLKGRASSHRHRIHQDNYRLIFILVLIAILVDLLVCFFIPWKVLGIGIGLAVLVLVYLMLHQKLFMTKELIGSLLYSAGIFLPACALTTMAISDPKIVLMFVFTLTVLINLILFSWYSWEEDHTDNYSSLATTLGRSRVKTILIVLCLGQVTLIGVLIFMCSRPMEALILAGMNLVLLMLLVFPKRFSIDNQYRLIGDFVFIFPILYFL